MSDPCPSRSSSLDTLKYTNQRMNPTRSPDQGTMESSHDDATPFTSTTNWLVSGGSLPRTLTFESSISPIDEDQAIANYAHRSPLILCPPSSDSSPCEITLSFTQKYEIRQVYVRSTARVYEIYYAPQQCSTNEYLCTVSCGIAAKDEDMVHLTHTEEVASSQQKASLSNLADRSLKSGSNLNTAEDEWIEVKALDSPRLDDKRVSLSSETNINQERIPQDFYEATAEINDADPCTSLTLRLLSVQSKGCVCIDELYVFADPVDPADSKSQAGPVENSNGSSLMAMFMPALMQLSKTRSVTQINEQQMFSAREKQKVPEVVREATDSTNGATKMQQEGNSTVSDLSNITTNINQDRKRCTTGQEVKSQVFSTAAVVGSAQLQCPLQVPSTQNQPDFPLSSQIHVTLDQLVSRVGKIEELCLKFEENMLKPISGIEKRLQRVEEQLEVFTKRTEDSRSCTRFSAPEFSCNDSDSNFNNSGSYLNCGTCESGERVIPSELSVELDDTSSSQNDVQLVSGLVVTAPEFCSGDDEEEFNASEPVTYPEICSVDYEENHASEPVTDPPEDKPSQTLSIDDAMSSALIVFLSSTSGQTGKYIQTLAVKAPEFSSENGSDISADKKASCVQSEIARDMTYFCENDGTECIKVVPVSPICFDEVEGTTCGKVSGSCSSNISEDDGSATASQNIDCYVEVAEGVNIQFKHNADGECNDRDSLFENGIEHETGKTEPGCIKIENAIAGSTISNDLVPLDTGIPNQILQNQEDGSSNMDHDGVTALFLTNLTVDEGLTKGSDKDILHNIIDFSHASSIVDFETPILDVKFISQENFATKSPLEALLADMPGLDSVAYIVEEVEDGSPIGEQSSLIVMEDGEVYGHAPDNNFFVDMNYFRSGDVPSSMEDETVVNVSLI